MIRIVTDSDLVIKHLGGGEMLKEEMQSSGKEVYIITRPDNVNKGGPTIIWAREGYKKYPIVQGSYMVELLEDIDEKLITTIYNRYHSLPNVVFETERLIVREITLGDLPRLYEIYSSPKITEYMEGLYEDIEEERTFTRAYIHNMYGFYGYGLWIVEDKATGEMLGRAGLSNREIDGVEQVELGYVIGVDYQRQGYGYEVCQGIIDFAKNVLKKEELFVCTDTNNLPSMKLAMKLGFEYYATSEADGTSYTILKRNL